MPNDSGGIVQRWRKRQGFLILIGLGVGGVLGWSQAPWTTAAGDAIAAIFINLLKMLSLPLVFLTIVSTISDLRDWDNLKRLGGRILGYTLGTTLAAATVALTLYHIINPAEQSAPPPGGDQLQHADKLQGCGNVLMKAFPQNFFEPFISGNVIGILILAILTSVAILQLPEEHQETTRKLFSALAATFIKMAEMVMILIPLAVAAFTIQLIGKLQSDWQLATIGWYVACIVAANLVQAVVVLPTLLIMKGHAPWQLLKAMQQALVMAFFSKSSAATMPATIQCAEQNAGVRPRIARIVIPMCTTVNMNACAAFILITYLFVARMNGYHFSLGEELVWIVIASIAAMGNAAVPMGCFFLASALLAASDVPLSMMGMILPVYALLDMLETAINVWSDACITALVDRDLRVSSNDGADR